MLLCQVYNCRKSAIPTGPFSNVSQVDKFWDSLCKKSGDPVACLANNFKLENKKTDILPGVSREILRIRLTQIYTKDGKFDAGGFNRAWNGIRIDLANSHFKMLTTSNLQSGHISVSGVREYHWNVFEKYGIGKGVYGGSMLTGTTFDDFYSFTWCPIEKCDD